jgi:diguanylate cyclase (GGDEF)-like protein
MKALSYRLAPVILPVTGVASVICLFIVHSYLPDNWQWMFWLILLLVSVISGVVMGVFIKRLHQGASKDPLTGLYNRRCFYDRMNYEMEKMKRTKSPLSLALIDIDNFKAINDTYGHLEGDRVLVQLAGIFKTQARSGDTVVRWGGEEFAIILPETDKNGAMAFAERVRGLVEGSNSKYIITISVGVTTVCQEYDAEKVVSIADRALYKAKEKKNMVMFLTE